MARKVKVPAPSPAAPRDAGEVALRREPVQARSRATVERILDATESLIDQSGVPAATTRRIAERAGVSPPSLYRFFENREQILDRLLERHLVKLEQHLTTAEAGWRPATIREFVTFQLGLYLDYFEGNPSAAQLWYEGRISLTVWSGVHERSRLTGVHLHELAVSFGLASCGDALPFVMMVELGDRVFDVALRQGLPADRRVMAEGVTALTAYLEQTLR